MTQEERKAYVANFKHTENTTISEALPVLEEIADELGVKTSNGKVMNEYFKRYRDGNSTKNS